MTPTDLAQLRMRNLRLGGSSLPTAEQVVHWLGAAQAQDYGSAKWSLGMRTREATDRAVDELMKAGRILRTHMLRPTWHFVAPADIRWIQALTAPRVHAHNAPRYRQLELGEAVLKKTDGLIVRALEDGDRLTRGQIAARLNDAGTDTVGQRLAYILMHAELNGLICSGGLEGKQHTYALVEERAPGAPARTRDEALAELTVRYFASHGPATAKDFGWWSSLTLGDIRSGLEVSRSRLEHAVVDGLTYWSAAAAPRRHPSGPTVHLVPTFDEYIVGYRESRHVLDAARRSGPVIQAAPVFTGIVVLDGQLIGYWKRRLVGDSVSIEAALFSRPSSEIREAVEAAAHRYGRFVGLPVRLATRQHFE